MKVRRTFALIAILTMLVTMVPSVRAAESTYPRQEFSFPLIYDPGSMEKTSGSTLNINKYGIYLGNSTAMRSADLTNSDDSQNIDGIRFSVNNSKKPSSPLEMMYMIFTSNQVQTPPVLNEDGYVIEADYTVWLHGGKQLDFVINGTDTADKAKTIGIIRAERLAETAVGGDKGIMYAVDAQGNKLEGSNEVPIVVTKPGNKGYAGDLVTVKASINLKTQTLSLWAKVKKSHGGSADETAMAEKDLLLRDIPFYTNVESLRGLALKIHANNGKTIEYGTGAWVTGIKLDKDYYPVSGTADEGIKAVSLLKNDSVIYSAQTADGKIQFPRVAAGTYDVEVTYHDRYVASENQPNTLTVTAAEKTDFHLTSVKVDDSARKISGTVDEGVQGVTLIAQADKKTYEGLIDSATNTISFQYLLPGIYDVLITARENYTVSSDNPKTIEVKDTDINDVAFRTNSKMFNVTGMVAKQVSNIRLCKVEEAYTGKISDGKAVFENIPDGTYEIEAECEQRYTPSIEPSSVTVNGADLTEVFNVIATPPADGITLRLGILSDMQYGRGGLKIEDQSRRKFRTALAEMKKRVGGSWDNLDVLMIPGDITHNSFGTEFQPFIDDLAEFLPPGSHTKVLFLRGNHDAKENTKGENRMDNFVKYISKYDPSVTDTNTTAEVNGYQFIMVSQDTQKSNDEKSTNSYIQAHNYLHSPETIAWFTDAVKTAAEKTPDKPIFIGMHPNTYEGGETVKPGVANEQNGTVFGSFPIRGYRNQAEFISFGDYWATSELYSAMKPYPNLITFSGHSHWTVANERSIHQRDFTSLNTGAVNNMEIEKAWDEEIQPKRFGNSENESNGYYITVNTDQKVTIERLDLYRMARDNDINARLGEDWVVDIASGKEGFTYTGHRDKQEPVFSEGAAVTVENITETGAKLVWDNKKVIDDTGVNNYWIEVVNKETQNVEKIYTPSAYYWLMGNDMPEKNEQNAKGLSPETTYVVKVYAMDQFYKKSSEPIITEFTTLSRALPAPLIDVNFTNADNGIRDNSNYARVYDMNPIVKGNTEMTWDETYKMYVANFTASDGTDSPNFFKVLLDNGRRNIMQSAGGYTLDLLFRPTALNSNAETAIVGAAQTNGFDVLYTKTPELTAEFRYDGAWQYPAKVQAPLNQYYHITIVNDGQALTLYLDGIAKGSVPVTGSLEFTDAQVKDAFYGLVIGGDYKPGTDGADQTAAQNAFTGQIAYTKIYGGALGKSEILKNHQSLLNRSNLKKADELKTVLTQTLPSLKKENNANRIEGLMDEGWRLLASEELTDDAITEYLDKASMPERYVSYTLDANNFPEKVGSDGKDVTVNNPSQYGIAVTGNGWSVAKNNSTNSLGIESVRLTDRGNAAKPVTGEVAEIVFEKDAVNNPNGTSFAGKYVFESEFTLRYSGDQYYAYRFNGLNALGEKQVFAELRFGKDKAYLVNADGVQIGKTVAVDLENDGPVEAVYVKMELDTESDTYSLWVVPRKTKTDPYYGSEPGISDCLGESLQFNQPIERFTGISSYANESSSTNGIWLYNIRIRGIESYADKKFAVTLDANLDDLIANNTAEAIVTVQNPLREEKELRLIYAVYNAENALVKVETMKQAISSDEKTAELKKTLTLTSDEAKNISRISLYVWDDSLLIPFASMSKQM